MGSADCGPAVQLDKCSWTKTSAHGPCTLLIVSSLCAEGAAVDADADVAHIVEQEWEAVQAAEASASQEMDQKAEEAIQIQVCTNWRKPVCIF